MKPDFFKRIAGFIAICLIQALVLNHIHLFNCATPLLYVYFVTLFRRNDARWSVMVWSFLMGLAMDTMSNTAGLTAASLTFIGFVQPMVFGLFIQRDSPEDMKPSIHSLGKLSYFLYATFLVFTFCVVYFSLEAFSFFNWLQWIKNILGSSIMTLVLIFVIESVKSNH
ncbi:MAG: rod shape-determining protein MreD [Prevotellaceae bacterium]|nr:rod shape-determining protein MreD [Prevotella sp.]MDD7530544.1 rod shape-determining protein MreD [Prevotellaceae bacterium]MDY2634618.1 rod shape-determining protein MreD [Prevotella sp.]